MKRTVELSIIVVNYMNYKLTIECIQSILKNLKSIKYEVIIFDNCSPNESFEKLNDRFQNVSSIYIYKSNKNNGFGAGNNQAITYTSSDFVLFLNPDVLVLDNTLTDMIQVIKKFSDIGIIGAKLLNMDHSLQYSCRRFLSFKEFLIARTPIKKISNQLTVKQLNDKYLMKDINHDIAQDVDWLMGSCLLVRKAEFLSLGGFSEEYFMYFEDVDLCYKYKLNNQRVYYYPHTKMIHLHEQASVKKINKLTVKHVESMFKFYKKYGSSPTKVGDKS